MRKSHQRPTHSRTGSHCGTQQQICPPTTSRTAARLSGQLRRTHTAAVHLLLHHRPSRATCHCAKVSISSLTMTTPCPNQSRTSHATSIRNVHSTQDEELSPYRHQKGRDRFDAFLFSPCQCHLTPPLRVSTSPTAEADNSTIARLRTIAAFWDEGMPDVLSEASQEMALDECCALKTFRC